MYTYVRIPRHQHKEVWSIKVRSPFGSPFEVKVKRTCSGRNLWLQVVLATEKLAGRGTVDIDSLYDGGTDATVPPACLPLCCLGLSNGCTVDAIDKKDQEWVIFIKCPDGSVIATPASKEESCIDLHRREWQQRWQLLNCRCRHLTCTRRLGQSY